MRKTTTLALIALIALSGPAFATGVSFDGVGTAGNGFVLKGSASAAGAGADATNEGVSLTNTFEASDGVRYSGEYTMNNVPNVSAPGLTTTLTETCMGSSSAGGAVAGFGITFGTTWRDSACVRRLDSRHLKDLGYNLAAKELMCDSKAVRAALLRAGRPCFEDLPEGVQAEIIESRLSPQPAPEPVATEGELVNPTSAVGALNR